MKPHPHALAHSGPTSFPQVKRQVGKFAPQFSGYGQQDCQVGGLSEAEFCVPLSKAVPNSPLMNVPLPRKSRQRPLPVQPSLSRDVDEK